MKETEKALKMALDAVEYLRICARRYEWLRENPAWESEAFLSNLTPEQFDEALDKRMAELTPND